MTAIDCLASAICDYCSCCEVYSSSNRVLASRIRSITLLARSKSNGAANVPTNPQLRLLLTQISEFIAEFEGKKDYQLLSRVQSGLESDIDKYIEICNNLAIFEQSYNLGTYADLDVYQFQLLEACVADLESFLVDFDGEVSCMIQVNHLLDIWKDKLKLVKNRLIDTSCQLRNASNDEIEVKSMHLKISPELIDRSDSNQVIFRGIPCHILSTGLQAKMDLALLRLIAHEGILRVFGFCQEDNNIVHAIIERSSRGSVFDIRHKFPNLPSSLLLYWIVDLLKAVCSCHERGFVHGDLSDKCMLLFDNLAVKLTGFLFASAIFNPSAVITKQPTFETDLTSIAILLMQWMSSSCNQSVGLVPDIYRNKFDELLSALFNYGDVPLSCAFVSNFEHFVQEAVGNDPRDVLGLSTDMEQVLRIDQQLNRSNHKTFVDDNECSNGIVSVMNEFLLRTGLTSDKCMVFSIRLNNKSINTPVDLKNRLIQNPSYLSQECRVSFADCCLIELSLKEVLATSSETKDDDPKPRIAADSTSIHTWLLEFVSMEAAVADRYSHVLANLGIVTVARLKQALDANVSFLFLPCGLPLIDEILLCDYLNKKSRFDLMFQACDDKIQKMEAFQIISNESWVSCKRQVTNAMDAEIDEVRLFLSSIMGSGFIGSWLQDIEVRKESLLIKFRLDWEDGVMITLTQAASSKLSQLENRIKSENPDLFLRSLAAVETDIKNAITLKCEIFGTSDKYIQIVLNRVLRNVELHIRAIRIDFCVVELTARKIFSGMSQGFGDLEGRISFVTDEEANGVLTNCLTNSLSLLKRLEACRKRQDCLWNVILTHAEVTISDFWREECSESMISRSLSVETRSKCDYGQDISEEEIFTESRQVLISVLQSMRGTDWSRDTTWSPVVSMRNWEGKNKQGINRIITNSEGYVTQLALDEFSLVGNLPLGIGFFSKLEILDCSKNQLNSIPSSVSNLTILRSLIFSYNNLNYISPSIGSLTNLKSLVMCYNKIKYIPEEIGRLIHLEGLVLNVNDISTLPNSIGQLICLKTLLLSYNPLKSLPESVSQLSALRMLDIRHCEMVSNEAAYNVWKSKLERPRLVLKI